MLLPLRISLPWTESFRDVCPRGCEGHCGSTRHASLVHRDARHSARQPRPSPGRYRWVL